ncbi:MAG: hypothetical protein ABIL09_19140 [Gemmatimonadota bacterium]
MSNDIGPILHGWDYAAGELRVRQVDGLDGKTKIQIRMDLGVMQMEWSDRPDGTRPHDTASLLEYHQQQLAQHQGGVGSQPFRLSREECWALSQEAMQYYWRRISFFEFKEYELAAADAEHNLSILDLCETYAEHDEDRQIADQYRVFVTSHRIQAHALQHLEGKAHAEALETIRSGICELEKVLRDQGDLDTEECTELRFLRDWEKEIEESRPLSPREKLRVDLKAAVEGEQFELAATLRDRLRQMEQDQR